MSGLKNGRAEPASAYLSTEIGVLEISGVQAGLTSILYVEAANQTAVTLPDCVREGVNQLSECFAGRRLEFTRTVRVRCWWNCCGPPAVMSSTVRW